MKILCLQLARFGDIFMSWPVWKALREEFPQAEIHGLVRERFAEAAHISGLLQKVIELPSSAIFSQLIVEGSSEGALTKIDQFLKQMQKEDYDLIINLSFSPLSSYLTSAIKSGSAIAFGYQRHADGYLCLSDDISRYFYAQVGTHQFNRYHVTDLMGTMAQVALQPSDSQFTASPQRGQILKKFHLESKDFIAFHLGASEAHKRLSSTYWLSLILQFKTFCPEFSIVLIGSKDESPAAAMIEKALHGDRLINLVGRTNWGELKDIFSAARLFVGADSGPMHLAGLMQAPILNLSIGNVNFWETGPRFVGAHLLSAPKESQLDVTDVLSAARSMLLGQSPSQGFTSNQAPEGAAGLPFFRRAEYASSSQKSGDFEWQLIQAIYMSQPYPSAEKLSFVQAIQDLSELNDLAIDAIQKFKEAKIEFLGPYLDRIYESMNLIAQSDKSVAVFVGWLRAEKCRVPPGEAPFICHEYLEIHQGLRMLLQPYVLPLEPREGTANYG